MAGNAWLHEAGCLPIPQRNFLQKNLYIRALFYILPVKNKR